MFLLPLRSHNHYLDHVRAWDKLGEQVLVFVISVYGDGVTHMFTIVTRGFPSLPANPNSTAAISATVAPTITTSQAVTAFCVVIQPSTVSDHIIRQVFHRNVPFVQLCNTLTTGKTGCISASTRFVGHPRLDMSNKCRYTGTSL